MSNSIIFLVMYHRHKTLDLIYCSYFAEIVILYSQEYDK
jgi:hypothetical protein